MMPDGSLAPRTHPGALLDPASAVKQAVRLAQSGRFDTICVHGDTKSAAETAAAVRQALRDAGVKTQALAAS